MRKTGLVLVFIACLIFPATASAQGPTPPPGISVTCYPEGKFHPIECFNAVQDNLGVGGLLVLLLIVVFFFTYLTPSGRAIQTVVQEKTAERLRAFSKPLPPAEILRREAEYLSDLEKSETLRQPEEIASQFDAYLNTLYAHENPLRPSEDRVFVDLESGLSIPPRIGLSIKVESNQSKSFAEQRTFSDLAEAMDCVDEQTGRPYSALALLGEPGAGKSTLLRKLARQFVQQRLDDPSKHLPIFVSLSAHKNGSPIAFLRRARRRRPSTGSRPRSNRQRACNTRARSTPHRLRAARPARHKCRA